MKKANLFTQDEKNPSSLDGWSALIPILFYLVCGFLLIFVGNVAIRVTAYVVSGLLICIGIWRIVSYFRAEPMKKITGSLLATGLALLLAGVLLAIYPDYLQDLLPFVWGLALLFGAFLKIEYAFDEKALNIEKWWIMLIFAGFSLVIGVITLLNPAFLSTNRELIIGIMLVVEAVLDIVVYLLISRALKKLQAPPVSVPLAAKPAETAPPAAITEGEGTTVNEVETENEGKTESAEKPESEGTPEA